jgi:hypothetical protein
MSDTKQAIERLRRVSKDMDFVPALKADIFTVCFALEDAEKNALELRPSLCERHKHAVPSLNSICEICDHEEAVADAVRQRTEEIATLVSGVTFEWVAGKPLNRRGLVDAILALNSPSVPVWQHKPDCATQFQWNAKLQRWALTEKVAGITECTHKSWNYCPSCGRPRPETKGA